MSSSDESWTEKLAELRAVYARDLPGKLAEIQDAWRAHLESPGPDSHSGLVRKVHNLSGTGATFGMPAVSEHARALERFLVDVVGSDPRRGSAHASGFDDLFARLVAASEGHG